MYRFRRWTSGDHQQAQDRPRAFRTITSPKRDTSSSGDWPHRKSVSALFHGIVKARRGQSPIHPRMPPEEGGGDPEWQPARPDRTHLTCTGRTWDRSVGAGEGRRAIPTMTVVNDGPALRALPPTSLGAQAPVHELVLAATALSTSVSARDRDGPRSSCRCRWSTRSTEEIVDAEVVSRRSCLRRHRRPSGACRSRHR